MFKVKGDSLPGPLIIGTFEKRAQGPDLPEGYPRGNRGVRGKGKRLSHN